MYKTQDGDSGALVTWVNAHVLSARKQTCKSSPFDKQSHVNFDVSMLFVDNQSNAMSMDRLSTATQAVESIDSERAPTVLSNANNCA